MFIVSQSRKKFTPAYRREAANLVVESDLPIAHVAGEIGVSPGLLGAWVKKRVSVCLCAGAWFTSSWRTGLGRPRIVG
ncbi:transposase [Corynebacterium auris]|uniref:transposase n=1 Tax=Corynebacterium auris TaxID=44750 RepID=UPI00338FEF08